MKQQVNLEIMQFVETQILPKYTEFGESHGLRHVTRVIRNALKLVPVTGADIDMVYIVAAYHDLGMSGPRAIHHITSGKILQADARLKRWFTPEQIKLANKTNSVKKYTVSDDGTLAQKDYYLEGALSWERITDEDNNATDMFNSIFGGF